MDRLKNNKLKLLYRRLNIPGIAYSTVIFFFFFCIITDWRIATPANIILILRNSAVLILASIGMNMVILVSQVDISIGPVMSLTGAGVAVILNSGMNLGVSLAAGLLTGMAVGLINGILVAVFKFDYWITTFATMGICSGLALVVADGGTVLISDDVFNWLGNGKIAGVYVMLYITVFIVAFVLFVLRKTKFGYNIYSIGGSEISARLNGVNIIGNRIAVFICSGFFASVAGIILSAMSRMLVAEWCGSAAATRRYDSSAAGSEFARRAAASARANASCRSCRFRSAHARLSKGWAPGGPSARVPIIS